MNGADQNERHREENLTTGVARQATFLRESEVQLRRGEEFPPTCRGGVETNNTSEENAAVLKRQALRKQARG